MSTTMTKTKTARTEPISQRVARNITRRFDNSFGDDYAAEEKAWANFASAYLAHLCRNPEEFNVVHLDLFAKALGVQPHVLVAEAEALTD